MPKQAKLRSRQGLRIKALAVAKLRADGLNQLAIAERTGFSQPEVSRLLQRAIRDWQFLDPRPRFNANAATPEDLAEAAGYYGAGSDHEEQLRKAMVGGLPTRFHVHVLTTSLGHAADDRFSEQAALCLLELLHRSKLVGVMCGRTLARIFGCVRSFEARSPIGAATDFIPICGDPLHISHLAEAGYSASQLAALLQAALGSKPSSELPTLAGVPAYLPRNLQFLGAVEQFIEGLPGYRVVFGKMRTRPSQALSQKLDTLITGVGILAAAEDSIGGSTGAFIKERLLQGESNAAELASLLHGDIGGLLLGKEALTESQIRRVGQLNDGWTGLRLRELKDLAKRTKRSGAPGVVVIASGANKADVVCEALRGSLVNELIIDRELADAIVETLPKQRIHGCQPTR